MSTEVYVTPGDVERIRRHTGRDGFAEYAPFDRGYLESRVDPEWVALVSRGDGTRRVLKTAPGGLCRFLGPAGCSLPLDVRPLLCRIYPFDFDRRGILGTDGDCFISRELPGGAHSLLSAAEIGEVREWRRALYEEIESDRARSVNRRPPGFVSRVERWDGRAVE